MIYLIIIPLVAVVAAIVGFMSLPRFGGQPSPQRLERIEQSPNFRGGRFVNREHTPQLTTHKSRARVMFDFLFEERVENRPEGALPAIKSDLRGLDRASDLMVWFGHSSYFLQVSGHRILVDPLFEDAAPVSFFNKPFEGTQLYKADDIPDLDLLIITHDHWDHLDYKTVVALRSRIKTVICPLGVGAHFERWGFAAEQIVEMDWDDRHTFSNHLTIHCLTARHFSGRGLRTNQTLWASFMVVAPERRIYLSGDGGYGLHFSDIARRFPKIDLAIMENGQYNVDWSYIHLLPEDLRKAVADLSPKRVFAGHNSKYALAKHPWMQPMERAMAIDQLVTPLIGQKFFLDDPTPVAERWWANIK